MSNLIKFNSHQLSIEQTEDISGGSVYGIHVIYVDGILTVVHGPYPTPEG